MKTLYITDLDGTLLTPEKTVSQKSKEILNRLIGEGMLFSVATARSAATASEILSEIHLNQPGILLNGVLLYDFERHRYLDCAKLAFDSVNQLLEIFREYQRIPFCYKLEEDGICVEFEMLHNSYEKDFYEERKDKAYKRFQKVEKLTCTEEERVIYFTMMDIKECLQPIYCRLQKVPGIRQVMYRDNYSNLYYLEIYSSEAGKSTGLKRLQKWCGAEKTVAFGDNLNDMDFLQEATVGLAVADGIEEIKKIADGVVGPSDQDGVAKYLEKVWEKRK